MYYDVSSRGTDLHGRLISCHQRRWLLAARLRTSRHVLSELHADIVTVRFSLALFPLTD
jgi:hypothetical protein